MIKKLLNIDFYDATIDSFIEDYSSGVIFPLNVDTMVLLQKDQDFYRACLAAEYKVVDSQVIIAAAKLSGCPFKGKISGSDFFPKFCEHHRRNGAFRIFLLGGMNDVASKVQNILNCEAGRKLVVGAHSPSNRFGDDEKENLSVVQMINASGANVLAIGLGAPKQEKWIVRYRPELPAVTMFIAVGATLDFIAGTQKRAPVWMQKAALEWLFRLASNPKRFFRRYLLRDLSFFFYYGQFLMGKYKNPFHV
ncbi:MAG TPA: WecB/TagA/CpsF family glycosyltransferase [Nitrosomonas sp.]|nr:WecB/TagA/CpsF family glycosyltransferase [Nitrosomonas sp.]